MLSNRNALRAFFSESSWVLRLMWQKNRHFANSHCEFVFEVPVQIASQ